MTRLHADELAIDAALVRRLLARSLPTYADLPVRPLLASGSTNALFRLGDELLVRLPRQPGGTAAIEAEARWLPVVAPALSVATPEVVAVGEPAYGYREKWSVTTWLDGTTPPASPVTDTDSLADDLARFVAQLRDAAVPDAAREDPAVSSYRAGPLQAVDVDLREAAELCRAIPDLDLDLDRVLVVWESALAAAPPAHSAVRWLHGDLFTENLLVHNGRLAGVLDFGGLAVGDPTVDLVVGWEALDPQGRAAFRRHLRVDDATWLRGMAWALLVAVLTFPYYWQSMPMRCAARASMARSVLREAS
ncbi:phosphotransferase [Marmoricola endophyticus]|uniref:Phosphotransferase n=1 Tax=Marmoricola endophyticus TaxID=2040280 RepID=A0A917F7S2_9ACTN|nr:aminoglycoside phosphotransferase family protein [Marmoricola endophyticus]GGF56326.1 phosphotransferase [Marmoricola endophyticus]